MKKSDFDDDNKVQAMVSLIHDIYIYPYTDKTKLIILTKIEEYAINYIINELPENETYSFYCKKLDSYVVKLIKEEIKE